MLETPNRFRHSPSLLSFHMSFHRFVPLVLFVLTLVCGLEQANGFQAWTSFQNGGLVSAEPVMPTSWSPSEGLKWKVDLVGYGQSTPVVFDNQIYVTSISGPEKEQVHVQAFATDSGKEVWQYEANNSTPEKNNSYVSRAAPSPVCDAEGVICFFEGGNLVALTHEGTVRWEMDLTKTQGDVKARHGIAASLEHNKDHVFVWVERETDPYVLALKKADGKVVWRSAGLGTTSWSSPRLIDVGESQHLVLSGSGKIAGLDPETGKRLWDFTEIGGNTTPTPVQVGNGRFLIGASAGRGEAADGKTAKSNGVVQIESKGDDYEVSWLWTAKRATSSFGSPMFHDNRAYFVNRQGVVFCLDTETGEEVYAQRVPSGSVWATPLALHGNVYLFGKGGVTTIIESADELEEIATNDLWEATSQRAGAMGGPVLYAATPLADSLVLRRGDTLYCVGKAAESK